MSSKVSALAELLSPTGLEEIHVNDGGVSKKIKHSNLYSAPGFGQAIVHTSARKRIFNFSANGSDERQKFVDLYQYLADELSANRSPACLVGAGDYGFDGNGLRQLFPNGATGLTFRGTGSTTRMGYVGNTESGSIWRVAEWEAENTPIKAVTSISHTTGVATAAITAHGASVGSTIWIYSAVEEEFNGLKVVDTVADANTLTYAIETTAAASATGTIECAVHDEFLVDFQVGNMTIMDTDSAAHAGATEETHGLGFKHMMNMSMDNLKFDAIGDESIELSDCFQFGISKISSVGTPSQEQTGGGVISIKAGCHGGIVDGFQLGKQGSAANTTYGVNFKTSSQTRECSHHQVQNGFIYNPVKCGIFLNTTGTAIKHVNFSNIAIFGGLYGITQGGSGNLLKDITFDKVNSFDATLTPFLLDRAIADCEDITVQNSIFDASMTDQSLSTSACLKTGGDVINLYNNSYRNGRMGIHGTSNSNNVTIKGGDITNCGGNTTTFAQYVYDQGTSRNMVVEGVRIKDGVATSVGFRGVRMIRNCVFDNCAVPSNWTGQDIDSFEGNIGVPYNVQLGLTGKSCINNEFIHTASGGNGAIRIRASGCVITGNTAPNLTSGDGIEEEAGVDNNIVGGNNMNGRPINLVGTVSLANDYSNI